MGKVSTQSDDVPCIYNPAVYVELSEVMNIHCELFCDIRDYNSISSISSAYVCARGLE